MGSLQQVYSAVNKTTSFFNDLFPIASLSRRLLHTADPDNYELYDMKIQVIDGQDQSKIIEEFDFVVMPDSVLIPRVFRTTVVPTFGGSYTLDSSQEAITNFQITGTFGYKHKAIINLEALKKSKKKKNQVQDINSSQQDNKPVILTGYGMIKRLEKIILITKAQSEEGVPYKTYLINKTFNVVQRVEIQSVNFRQDISKNTLWFYDINFIKIKDEKPATYEDSSAEITKEFLQEGLTKATIQGTTTALNYMAYNRLKPSSNLKVNNITNSLTVGL